MSTLAEEIRPFLVCRRTAQELECALWNLAEGGRALALFLTADNAAHYLQVTSLDASWEVFQPERDALLKIFQATRAADVRLAVLDPDHEQAKRIFDLDAVLRAAEG